MWLCAAFLPVAPASACVFWWPTLGLQRRVFRSNGKQSLLCVCASPGTPRSSFSSSSLNLFFQFRKQIQSVNRLQLVQIRRA